MIDPKEEKLAIDVFAWFLNVLTSVLIVFVNKVLMDPKVGYGFVFGKSKFLSSATIAATRRMLRGYP